MSYSLICCNMLLLGSLSFTFSTVVSTMTEISTMAGRRLRDAVKTVLSSHKDFENVHIVISALSNAYSQYATTYEEYHVQRYEVSCKRRKSWSKYFYCICSM
jgi:hypothetical protein